MEIIVGLHAGVFIVCCLFAKHITDLVKMVIVECQGLFY